jgi:hypothetical protein
MRCASPELGDGALLPHCWDDLFNLLRAAISKHEMGRDLLFTANVHYVDSLQHGSQSVVCPRRSGLISRGACSQDPERGRRVMRR